MQLSKHLEGEGYVYSEAMILSMEDMQKNASEMEKHICKGMMEIEARSHGLELDSRHNARDMWAQLSEHMASMTVADPMEHTHAETGVTHPHAGGDVPRMMMTKYTYTKTWTDYQVMLNALRRWR